MTSETTIDGDGDLYQIQREIEERGIARGREKALAGIERKIDEGEVHTLAPVRKLIAGLETRMREALEGFLDGKRGRGRPPEAVKLLQDADRGLVAAEGLRVLFQAVLSRWDVRTAVCRTGSYVETEIWLAAQAEADPKRVKAALARAEEAGKRSRDASLLMQLGQSVPGETGPLGWSTTEHLRVGELLLQAGVAIGLFEQPQTLSEQGEGIGTDELAPLALVPAVAEALADQMEHLTWTRASRPVMVVPPRPWDRGMRGPYYTRRLNRHIGAGLIRSRRLAEDRRAVQEAVERGDLDDLMDALNILGRTPLRIDGEAVDALEWAFEQDLGKKLPRRRPFEIPALPANIRELPPHEQKKLRRRRRRAQQREKGRQTLCVFTRHDIATARELSRYREVFLPHNLDSRQRCYPVPWFNHQRSDALRAAWRFARKRPVGLTGGYWLAVTVATHGGFDKVDKASFDERYLWTDLNSDVICDIAENWKENRVWLEADKPFQFLAACREWKAYVDSGLSEAFESDLVVAFDGSNSGVQHLSGMSRDRAEAALVNLVPGEEGQDAYSLVAGRVEALVRADAEALDLPSEEVAGPPNPFRELARLYLDCEGVTRAMVKRNVMTYSYSSGVWGFRSQILEDYMDPLEEQVLAGKLGRHPFGERSQAAAGYLARKVHAEVVRLLPQASARMRWLQQVAALLAHEGKPVRWTTPLGMPISHRYSEWETSRVLLFRSTLIPRLPDVVGNEGDVADAIKVTLRTQPLRTLDKTKQRNAIAPNVVHSQDSSHLLMVVLAAAREGISDQLMIHDSFGCHAAQAGRFGEIIREQFVRLYTDYDVLQRIFEQASEDLSEEGRKRLRKLEHGGRPPARGSWDVREALGAVMAFS